MGESLKMPIAKAPLKHRNIFVTIFNLLRLCPSANSNASSIEHRRVYKYFLRRFHHNYSLLNEYHLCRYSFAITSSLSFPRRWGVGEKHVCEANEVGGVSLY